MPLYRKFGVETLVIWNLVVLVFGLTKGVCFTGGVFVLGEKAICGPSKEVDFRGVSQKRDH